MSAADDDSGSSSSTGLAAAGGGGSGGSDRDRCGRRSCCLGRSSRHFCCSCSCDGGLAMMAVAFKRLEGCAGELGTAAA